MKVQVRVFAMVREMVGAETIELEVQDAATVSELRAALLRLYPELKSIERFLKVAVNADFAGDATVLHAGDEIVVLPPVSGG
jgi:molybdopterin synthase sulfur carrier subunit